MLSSRRTAAASDPQAVAVGVVVAAGIAFVAAAEWMASRPLLCGDDEQLAGSYATRFFLRVAFAEGAALVAFAVTIAMGRWWLFFIGAAFTAAEFARLAPTARNLALDQRRLRDADCQRNLVASLTRDPEARSGR